MGKRRRIVRHAGGFSPKDRRQVPEAARRPRGSSLQESLAAEPGTAAGADVAKSIPSHPSRVPEVEVPGL